MTGIAPSGSQIQLNALGTLTVPLTGTSLPGSGNIGQYFVNTSTSAVSQWNGTSWVAAAAPYLALLTSDPTGLTTIAALSECGDAGYSRVQVTFTAATSAAPSVLANASLVTFGPFSVNMSLPCQWLALVSVSTGTTGLLLNTWTLSSPQQVSANSSINIAAGSLQITDS